MSGDSGPTAGVPQRRSSITQAALSNLFSRGPSVGNVPPIPAPGDNQRRRLSVNTIGLSGTSPTNSSVFANIRRGSISTNSSAIDENAIDDDEFASESSRTAPGTPFVRRMSFGTNNAAAMRGYRPGGGSPGNGNNNPSSPPPSSQLGRRASIQKSSPAANAAWPTPGGRRASIVLSSSLPPQASYTLSTRAPSDNAVPRADQQAFNWSEQLRSRAESSVSGARPSFSFGSPPTRQQHDRARSVSDMVQPPSQAPAPPKPERPKPDAFQERILKGDFYMD